MKILHISPDMYTGGAQKFCIDICNELCKNKDLQLVICSVEKLSNGQQIMYKKISPKVQFISLGKEGKSPFIIFKIAKMIFDVKPDITHTHTRAQMFAALGLVLYSKPNIHTIHSVAHKETTKGRLKFYKFLYDYFKFTPVSISNQVLKSSQDFYGKHQDTKIDNGTFALEKTDEYSEVKKFIDTLKSNEKTKVFVSIGRLYNVKNQELLIDAFETVFEEGFDAHLIVLGSLDIIPEYAKKCQDKIKTKNRIHLVGEKSNIADFLIESDCLCFSSLYEGLPMAVIEAMSLGIPTISTPVGGMIDVIDDGVNGYLSDDMSVKSYTKTLKQIIENDKLDFKIIKNLFREKYSIKMCAQKYLNLYKEKIENEK